MNSETGVSINKPVSVLKKSIKVNFRDIFKAQGKAGVDANLTDAKLEGAVFEGANLKGTIFRARFSVLQMRVQIQILEKLNGWVLCEPIYSSSSVHYLETL